MKVKNPRTGKFHEVTDRAFILVYKKLGFFPVEVEGIDEAEGKTADGKDGSTADTTGTGAAADATGADTTEDSPAAAKQNQHSDRTAVRLSAEQYAEDTKDRPAIMEALDRLGVEYGGKDRKDDLKAQLDAVLVERDLMPQ